MKISENWLREWVNPTINTEQLIEQLTMLGLEVDGVEPAAGDFTKVIVSEIVAIEKHPDADKLNVCQVNIGGDELIQIVCGAPNARKGLKAPLAMIGAVLPGNFKIKKSKLRGVESFGMLCSNVELRLSEDHSGLLELASDAPVGSDIRDYLQLNDSIIDIDLTPNRADCFNVNGIALDVACMNNIDIKPLNINIIEQTHNEVYQVNLEAVHECPRYLSRVIKNIDNSKSTPVWMQERLRRSGIRSIHPVVDITNYVMLELGQPMHAFDKAELNGAIHVKMASKGDEITLLDGKEVKLDESFLMIADESHYLAIAGVMGGLNSGVTETTKDIVFESAYFNPSTIMGKSRDLGVHTESALRFERGVDYNLQEKALHRATQLLVEICGGDVGEIVEAVSEENLPRPNQILLSKDKVNRVLGFDVANEEITRILKALNMDVKYNQNTWTVVSPSNRFDIAIAEDLIEEIVRVVGYDNMPSAPLSGKSSIISLAENKLPTNTIKSHLNHMGYFEAINYSFVSEKQLDQCGMLDHHISLANPLTEEFAIMRTSLLPGMLETVKYNLRRQNDDLKFYETGYVFSQQQKIVETDKLLAVRTGKRDKESWGLTKENIDFFDIKGDLENLISKTKKKLVLAVSKHDFLHPGRQANVELDGKCVGWIGQIHPEICRVIGIKKDVYAFELFMKDIEQTSIPVFEDVSKFPSVRRDIAMLLNHDIDYQQVADIVVNEVGKYLVDIIVFDEYKDDTIDNARRSLAIGIVLQQKNATFEDKDVDKLVSKVVSSITSNLNAEIRGG